MEDFLDSYRVQAPFRLSVPNWTRLNENAKKHVLEMDSPESCDQDMTSMEHSFDHGE